MGPWRLFSLNNWKKEICFWYCLCKFRCVLNEMFLCILDDDLHSPSDEERCKTFRSRSPMWSKSLDDPGGNLTSAHTTTSPWLYGKVRLTLLTWHVVAKRQCVLKAWQFHLCFFQKISISTSKCFLAIKENSLNISVVRSVPSTRSLSGKPGGIKC